jgi:hypothetical protein
MLLTKAERRRKHALNTIVFEDASIDDMEWNNAPASLQWQSIKQSDVEAKKDTLVETLSLDPWIDGAFAFNGTVYFVHQATVVGGPHGSALMSALFQANAFGKDLIVNGGAHQPIRCLDLEALLPELPPPHSFELALNYMYKNGSADLVVVEKIPSILVTAHILRMKELFRVTKSLFETTVKGSVLKPTVDSIIYDLKLLPDRQSTKAITDAIRLMCDNAQTVSSSHAERTKRKKRMSVVISRLAKEKMEIKKTSPQRTSHSPRFRTSPVSVKDSEESADESYLKVENYLGDKASVGEGLQAGRKATNRRATIDFNSISATEREGIDPWESHFSEEHDRYYLHNTITGETKWAPE